MMADEPNTDPEAAARFLEWLRPGGPWVLSAKATDSGRFETATLRDLATAADWIAARNGQANLYVMINPARGPLASKAKKKDVEELAFLHVDMDVKAGDLDSGLAAIRAKLEAFAPRPSAVTFSGGGYWGFWRLAPGESLYLGGDDIRVADAEAYNRGLERVLQADNCHNVDRICRLPGTINIPDEGKRRRGREAATSSIVWLEDNAHALRDFMPVYDEAQRAGSGRERVGTAKVDRPDVVKLNDPAELEKWLVPPWARAVIVEGTDPTDPDRWGGDRSNAQWAVTCELARCTVPPGLIVGILTDKTWGIASHVLDQKDHVGYAWKQVEKAYAEAEAADVHPSGRRVLDPAAPFATASQLRAELFPDAIHTNDDWLEYDRGAYRAVEDATMRAALWSALDAAVVRTVTNGVVTFEPLKPGPGQVSGVLDALKGVAHQPADRMAPPVWLVGEGPPPGEIVALRNGLLHVPSGELLPPTPRFFTRNALDLDFHPGAPEPVAWQDFVESVFPDTEAAALLQEWFGYFLLPDTSQEKMLLLVGPPRSGKGTIQKVLTELVGRANVCAPSIKSLGGNFGLQPMIGKQVAFLSDIRIGSGSDRAAITETLLRITGRDDVTADRKNKEAWTGRLAVRFFIATNEMPSLSDNSPALAHRFVPLILERSFLGKEDPGLADRLVSELPGILNWALAGWRRLRERGHFVLPDASTAAIGEIMELGSPVAAFIRDMCEVAAGRRVQKERLYAAWQRWCEANKLMPGRIEHFARNLRAATSHQVDSARPSIDGQRTYVFEGIALSGDDVPY